MTGTPSGWKLQEPSAVIDGDLDTFWHNDGDGAGNFSLFIMNTDIELLSQVIT